MKTVDELGKRAQNLIQKLREEEYTPQEAFVILHLACALIDMGITEAVRLKREDEQY